MDSGVSFYFVQFCFVCSFSALTLLVWSFDPSKPVPDITYNVFGGTLNLAQSQSCGAAFNKARNLSKKLNKRFKRRVQPVYFTIPENTCRYGFFSADFKHSRF